MKKLLLASSILLLSSICSFSQKKEIKEAHRASKGLYPWFQISNTGKTAHTYSKSRKNTLIYLTDFKKSSIENFARGSISHYPIISSNDSLIVFVEKGLFKTYNIQSKEIKTISEKKKVEDSYDLAAEWFSEDTLIFKKGLKVVEEINGLEKKLGYAPGFLMPVAVSNNGHYLVLEKTLSNADKPTKQFVYDRWNHTYNIFSIKKSYGHIDVANNGSVIFQEETTTETTMYHQDIEGNEEALFQTDKGHLLCPRISSDDKYAIFMVMKANFNKNLYIIDLTTKKIKQIGHGQTTGKADITPDGKHIAYSIRTTLGASKSVYMDNPFIEKRAHIKRKIAKF